MASKSIKNTIKIVEEELKSTKKNDKKKIIGKGLEVKDNPDKIDKKDFDSNEEEEIDDLEEENEEDEAEEAEEETEAEEAEETEEEKDKGEDDEEIQGGDNECVYKITKKKKIVDIELDAAGEDTFEDDDDEPVKNNIKYVKPEDRITKPYLYEFERVRLFGERAKQISMGAKPMIKNVDKLDPKSIARLEIENKVIPLMILRELPDGSIEKWKIGELN